MSSRYLHELRQRRGAYLMAFSLLVSLFNNIPAPVFADTLSVTVLANGQATLDLTSSSDTFDLSIASTGATACQMTSPVASGVATSTTTHFDSSNSFFPTAGGSTTFTVTCTDGTNNISASAVVNLTASSGSGGATTTPTADIKINGSDGPTVMISNGDSYTYAWTSTNATACQLTSPVTSGISTSGSVTVDSSNSFYPTASSTVNFTITCTDGTNVATDSVSVGLTSGGGGGGGTLPTVDAKVDGSDGPVTLSSSTTPFTLSWTSTNATACQMTSPLPTASGVSLSGSQSIGPSNLFYASSSPVTFTFICTDGTNNATDSVTVKPASTTATSSSVTAFILVNGSHAATINNGDSYTYSWGSTGATACQLTSPVPTPSGISTSGTSTPIGPGSSFYPTVGGLVTYSISCTDGTNVATDTATVTAIQPSNGGGGGGGGGGNVIPPAPFSAGGGAVIGTTVSTGAACLYLKDYMREDFHNDPVEVLKLQAFLKDIEGYNYVQLTGVFDSATFQAVSAFQERYRDDILTPWALPGPTGYVYILTLKKINEIYCLHAFPLNEAQQEEISAFRALIQSHGGSTSGLPVVGTVEVPVRVAVTSTSSDIGLTGTGIGSTSPAVAVETASGTPIIQGQNRTSLAAAIFAAPPSFGDAVRCGYEFLLILVVLYILGMLVEDVLYKKGPETVLKRSIAKWSTFGLGLIVSLVLAYFLHEWCLLLPLLIALILTIIWTALYPQHKAVEVRTKAYLARIRTPKATPKVPAA